MIGPDRVVHIGKDSDFVGHIFPLENSQKQEVVVSTIFYLHPCRSDPI